MSTKILNGYTTQEEFETKAIEFWENESCIDYINDVGIKMGIEEGIITIANIADYASWEYFNQVTVANRDFNEWLANSLFDEMDIDYTLNNDYYPIFYCQELNDLLDEFYDKLQIEFNKIGNRFFDEERKEETLKQIKDIYFN